MKEEEFRLIATRIADVLDDIYNLELQEKIANELKELASKFVIYNSPTY
jgi:glycine hydroxymethyltransferase